MSQGYDGLAMDYGQEVLALDSAGNGERAVRFVETFVGPPQVQVIIGRADEAAGAIYRPRAGTITATGYILEVIGSVLVSSDVKICWQAHEKPGG